MKILNLSDFTLLEKFYWLEESYGDYRALELVVKNLPQPGVALEKLVLETQRHAEPGDIPGDDLVAWYVEGSCAVDALEFWIQQGYEVESAVDSILAKFEFTHQE